MERIRLALLAFFALVILGPIAVAQTGSAAGQRPPAKPDEPRRKLSMGVEEFLRWLPADTQTLIVNQAPSRKLDDAHLAIGQHLLSRVPPSILADQPVTLTVEGSRRFRAPGGLGLMHFEGATIILFEGNLKQADARMIHEKADRTEDWGDLKVSRTTVEREDGEWTFYAVQPRADVLVYATDRDYLIDLLSAMGGRDGPQAFPEDLPEWGHVDTSAGVWAIRHYDRRDVQLDPSTPLGGHSEYVKDEGAVGLAFSYDPVKRAAVLAHISGEEQSIDRIREWWHHPEVKFKTSIERTAPDVVTFKAEPEDEFYLLFRIALVLGHGTWP